MTVRFCWFNLMPWSHLPDDLPEKNRSIRVEVAGHMAAYEQTAEVVRPIEDFPGS